MADYVFYNANPEKLIESDCVCRAISNALGIDYKTIKRKLYHVGELFDCEQLAVSCYHHLLEHVYGLVTYDAAERTVRELVEQYPTKTLIIRMAGHLTMAAKGIVYDLWDCREEIADVFWIVPTKSCYTRTNML